MSICTLLAIVTVMSALFWHRAPEQRSEDIQIPSLPMARFKAQPASAFRKHRRAIIQQYSRVGELVQCPAKKHISSGAIDVDAGTDCRTGDVPGGRASSRSARRKRSQPQSPTSSPLGTRRPVPKHKPFPARMHGG